MTKTTYGREIMSDERLIARSIEVLEEINGCICTFPIEYELNGEKYTVHERMAHTNWDIMQQAHSNPGWQYYLECHGCGYQYARNYWTHNHLEDLKKEEVES